MKLHRNSQKRILFEDAVYFVTSKTHNNYPYFRERLFCDVFVENLRTCKLLKGFLLYGWVLNFDHFHLLLQPNDKFNISKIMKSLKENVSCAINRIMDTPITEGGTTSSRLRGNNDISRIPDYGMPNSTSSRLQMIYRDKYDIAHFQTQFHKKYPNYNPFPKFKWQDSFFDHFIRNESDFAYHLDYIEYNPDKHGLPDNWKYIYTNPKFEDLIDG